MATIQNKSQLNPKLQEKLWLISSRPPVKSEFLIVPKWKEICDVKNFFSDPFDNYCLELGSGWGEVAIQLAEKNPNIGFVLMEKKRERIQETLQYMRRKKLNNIRFISVNFNWYLDDLFKPSTFDRVILNFPDPWPKKKHRKNRTVSLEFLMILAKIIKNGGDFQFATDYGPYARKAISLFRKMKDFFSFQEEFSFKREDFPKSKFETMKIREGKKIYYLERKVISQFEITSN